MQSPKILFTCLYKYPQQRNPIHPIQSTSGPILHLHSSLLMSGLDYYTTTRYVFALATSTTQYQFHPSTNVTISITYLRCDQAAPLMLKEILSSFKPWLLSFLTKWDHHVKHSPMRNKKPPPPCLFMLLIPLFVPVSGGQE